MSAGREHDALQLVMGTLRSGDTVVELGACEHSLASCDSLVAGARVYESEAELGGLKSIAWLRLASPADLSTAVQVAVLKYRPRIVLGTGEGVASDEVLAWLQESGYCAMARVGAHLFLMPRGDCQQPAARASGKKGAIRAAIATAREIVDTGKQIALAPIVDGGRNMSQAIKLYRPPTVRTRKLMKLATDPRRFLEDARSPWLHTVAARALTLLPARNAPRRVTTCFDLPKRSVLVFCHADPSTRAPAWSRLLEDAGLATEVVVVADAALHDSFAALVASAACPRLRVYLIAGSASGQTLLNYGIARCYASNLAIVNGLEPTSADAVAEALAKIRNDRPYVVDIDGVVAVTRDRLRDQSSGEQESAELAAALASLASTIPASVAGAPPPVAGAAGYFAYSTLSPERSFSRDAHPPVVCLEKRPEWNLPVSPAIRAQQARVSVIMTVYNAAATVQQAVESVLAQSYRNLELLIVDDGSDDGSLDILLALARADSRVQVLITANNSGTYFAKNVGLHFAQGEYVSFHDSDDISAGNRLQVQVEALDCDPLAIANYTRYQRISEEGREVWFGGKTNRPGYITLLFRRKQVIEAVGFFDSVRISADAELVDRLRLTTQRPVRLLPFVTYYALQAEGSLTTAGAGAFAPASNGKVSMPPVRQRYREAADAWHRECHLGQQSARIPFPLGRRPFEAPDAILPDRGYSTLAERLVELVLAMPASQLQDGLTVELQLCGQAKLEVKVLAAIDLLAARKRVRDCRKLFLASVEAMERHSPQSGLAFADRNSSWMHALQSDQG